MSLGAFKGEVPKFQAKNFEFVGYHDLNKNPGLKLALDVINDRWYLYVASFWVPYVSVLDVTDPYNPILVNQFTGGGPINTNTCNIQVADGIMLLSLQKLVGGWGNFADPEHPDNFEEGIVIYDCREDPVNPKKLGSWKGYSIGTHRNHYDGDDYAHLTAYVPGCKGAIYVILDVSDLNNPKEVSRWFLPEQFVSAGGVPEDPVCWGLHGPPQVYGDRAYLSYTTFGAIILDISDKRNPKLVSRLTFGNGVGNFLGVHTYLPIPGTNLAIISSELSEKGEGPIDKPEDMGENIPFAYLADISDEKKPRVISSFPNPQPPEGAPYKSFHRKAGRFGPHNWYHVQTKNPHLLQDGKIQYCAWFNAGLRAFDISDPLVPVETGYFLPEDPKERLGPMPITLSTSSEDILVDSRGYAYLSDKNHGIFIVKYTG